jgi:hypothetical protein
MTVKNPPSSIVRALKGTIDSMGYTMGRFKKNYRGTDYDLDYSYYINMLRIFYSSSGYHGNIYTLLNKELKRVNPGLPYRIEGSWQIKYVGNILWHTTYTWRPEII